MFLVGLIVDNESKRHIFLFFAKGTHTNIHICFSHITKRGWYFGLNKVLLAEGDATFPFSKASQYFAAQDPPVEKNNDAGAERQRELQEKNQRGKLNVRSLSYSIAHQLLLRVSVGNTFRLDRCI